MKWGIAVVIIATSLAVAAFAETVDARIAVIIHPDRDASLDAADVAQIFLKKRRFWSNGDPIVAINREGDSRVRERFSERVFGGQARRLSDYWNRQYFLGVLPPATLASDRAVRSFVAIEPNAIGYIRADALDPSVKVLLFLDGR